MGVSRTQGGVLCCSSASTPHRFVEPGTESTAQKKTNVAGNLWGLTVLWGECIKEVITMPGRCAKCWDMYVPRSLVRKELPWSEVQVLVTQSCPTLCDPVDYSVPGCSVHGISQARILEWVAISFSRGSSRPRNRRYKCRPQFQVERCAYKIFCEPKHNPLHNIRNQYHYHLVRDLKYEIKPPLPPPSST